MRQLERPVKKVAGVLAVSAATVGVCSVHAQAVPLYWDVSADSGLQAGDGVWDATGGTNWADSDSPGTAAPGPWVQDSDAVFPVNGTSGITVSGDVRVNSISVAQFATPTLSADSSDGDDSLTLGAGGISHTGNNPLTFNMDIRLGASQAWHSTSTENGILVNGSVGETAAGLGLTKTGAGRVVLAGGGTYTGTTTINEGLFQVGNGGTAGSLASSAIALNGGRLTFSSSGDHTYAGSITGAAVATSWVTKLGSGTLTLTGNNVFNGGSGTQIKGGLNVDSGRVVLKGTASASYGIYVGGASDLAGMLTVEPGATLTAGVLRVGGASTGAGGLIQTGGLVKPNSQLLIGVGGHGFYHLQDGTLEAGPSNYITVSNGGGGLGVFYQSGGTVTSTQGMRIAYGGDVGIVALTGGTLSITTIELATQVLGAPGKRAEVTIGGNAIVTHTGKISIGASPDADAILNLNGNAIVQTWSTNGLVSTTTGGTHIVNFDGGTMRYAGTATGSTLADASANYSIYVHDGNAIFDVVEANGRSTIAQPLLAPTGDGIVNTVGNTVPIVDGGSGYVGAPIVTITGAPGATAIANMVDDGTGRGTFKVESITITSPGINAVAPSFTFSAVPGATPAQPVALTTAPNISGGLIKKGLGTLDLSAANTYTGETVIEAGTLRLVTGGDLSHSSAVNVAGGATFQAVIPATLRGLKGAGTVAGQPVTLTESLAPGDSIGTLQVNAPLVIGDGVVYEFEVDLDGSNNPISDLVIAAGGLSFVGDWTLKVIDLGVGDPDGLEFTLFTYTGADPTLGLVTVDLSGTSWAGASVGIDTENNRIFLTGLVPEPSALALLGLASLPMLRRRRI